MEPCFSNEHHHPHHHHHHHNHHHRHDRHQQSPLGLVSKRSHSIIKAIIFTDIINKQWNPQTSTKRPAMGRLGSEIPKCYQFLLGLHSLRERWCCFPKKLVNEAIQSKTIAKTSCGGLTFKFLQTILLPELTEPGRTMIFTKPPFLHCGTSFPGDEMQKETRSKLILKMKWSQP